MKIFFNCHPVAHVTTAAFSLYIGKEKLTIMPRQGLIQYLKNAFLKQLYQNRVLRTYALYLQIIFAQILKEKKV